MGLSHGAIAEFVESELCEEYPFGLFSLKVLSDKLFQLNILKDGDVTIRYFQIPIHASSQQIVERLFSWACSELGKTFSMERAVKNCEEHQWTIRRDGRRCARCYLVEFGRTVDIDPSAQQFSERFAKRDPEVVMDKQQDRIRELEEQLFKYYEALTKPNLADLVWKLPPTLREDTERLLGIVQTSNLG